MPATAAVHAGPGTEGDDGRRSSSVFTWLPLVGIALLMLTVVRQVVRPLTDPDLWWHLRLGDEFRRQWSLRDPGQLSPFATNDWVPTQWLPEVAVSIVEDVFGLPGVAWVTGAALLALVACVFSLCRREGGGLPAAVATAAAVVGMSASLSPRPHLVTYILLAVTLAAWLDTARDLRPRWWLVPVSWVWACSHGMWFTGVVVGVVVVIGLRLDKALTAAAAMRLAMVPVLCLAAAALTPVGPRLLTTSFAVGNISMFVTEWQPPSFREIAPFVTMTMICLTAVTWARRGRAPWTVLGLLALATGWTLLSQRTVTLGALIAAPLLAAAAQGWISRSTVRGPSRRERVAMGASAFVALAGLAVVLPGAASVPGGVPNDLNPDLAALPPDTVVLNAYELGGWLAWRHPGVAPVVDGLTEAYPTSHLAAYGVLTSVRSGWEGLVESSGSTHALLQAGSPLATALQERASWRVVGTDAGYVLLEAGN